MALVGKNLEPACRPLPMQTMSGHSRAADVAATVNKDGGNSSDPVHAGEDGVVAKKKTVMRPVMRDQRGEAERRRLRRSAS